ncbi:MAG TPA: hypothetical protein VJQ09_07260 [Candidatus Limnocylindria bacterium]|nr:hypothetical protein [Candidatus Limnocylindria bacterium]
MAGTIVVGVPVWIQDRFVGRPLAEDAVAAGVPYLLVASLQVVFGVGAALSFIGAASLIVWRKRRSAFATFVAVALLLRVPGFVSDLGVLGASVPAWAGPTITVRCLDAVVALLFLFVFPTGRFVPRWGAWVWAAWAAWVFATIATPAYSPVTNLDQWWAEIIVAGLAITGLAAQLYRYRSASTPHQRLQTKWVVYGLAVYVVVFATQQLVPVLFPAVRGPGAARLWYRLVGDLAADASATLVPITIGIAILRSHLLDIDLIINRTLVYLAATAILASVFAALSTAAQYVLGEITGHGNDALSIVIALAVAIAFAPVKTYVQQFVDRRLRTPARG